MGKFVFAGGGTGGHLFPAIAIAEMVRQLDKDADILFVGTRKKLEARIVPARGYRFRTLWISGFHRTLSVDNLLFPLKVIVSMVQAYSILKRFSPDVVIGTGGYVSGPVLRTAAALKIPTLIQEQNSYPGVTTRMLAARVNEVHLTFERSRSYLARQDNVFVSGNPTRDDLGTAGRAEAAGYFGFEPADRRRTLLVFGGSLGARTINRAVEQNLHALLALGVRLLWQTGDSDHGRAAALAAAYPSSQVCVRPFVDRMDCAYALADLVICRAGATTIAELTRLGKAAILVPYPHAAADHQVENARTLVEAGAAVMVTDDLIASGLLSSVRSLLEGDTIDRMAGLSKKFGRPEAARTIAERVLWLAEQRRRAGI